MENLHHQFNRYFVDNGATEWWLTGLKTTRSKIVQRETMNRVAVELGLDKMVVYSAKLSSHNNHMYGNALEALIGAIYLDQGYEVCYNFIQNVLIKKYVNLETIARKEVNFKP